MITIKQDGKKAWVTFTFSPTYAVDNVSVSGEWNQWREEPMKKKKNGDFYITKVLKLGNSFQFGYKVNHNAWVIEKEYPGVPTVFDSQNSLLKL